jgi:serine/threonine protein kinase
MSQILDNDKVGSFKILKKIGEGGMAIIYKATQPALKRDVVIKKLKDPNREIIERFKKEAFVSASLSQENVLSIYDFIYYGRSYYLVMEYVDGQDLRTIIDFVAPLKPHVAALIIREVAKGLEYTHSKNIIHRDIKPSNIIISYNGEVKLIDFGVAKDEALSKLTVTGMIVGTPSYMSPEQANGDRLGKESDLYSLGVLLYEMVTGLKPFSGDTNTEVLMKIAKGKFPSAKKYNRDIPWRLNRIIKKAMKKDRAKRYRNASELIRDLNKYIPWHEHTHKKEVLSQYLKKFDAKSTRKTSTRFQPVGLQSDISPKFWLSIATVIILFIFGASQLSRFLSLERFAEIEISTNVAQCDVYLDNRMIGKIDEKFFTFKNLLPGDHQLAITGPKENGIYQANVSLSPGSKTSIAAYVPRRTSSVVLNVKSTPSGADFYINDRLMGKTPLERLAVGNGIHEIKLSKDGHKTYLQKSDFATNQSYHLHVTLKPIK